MTAGHVKTTDFDDGGCLICDECDLGPSHRGRPCDCDCEAPAAAT